MAAVLGIGGVFVRSRDPDAVRAWYRDLLDPDGTLLELFQPAA